MSLKRDKFSSKEKYFMNIAINIAKSNNGYTAENPSVGCVVVKNNQILSFGTTSYFGRPHAEVNALKSCKNTKGSTVYLTLEPCTHFGKTPPCTDALIKAKIKKVIYSLEDIDSRTSNKSKKILNTKKIIVKSGLLKSKTKKIYNQYYYAKKNHLPYLTAKLACSKNFKIFQDKTQITNEYSKKNSHILRSKNQAILTTSKTVNTDNPKLNCRILGLEKFSPIKIIIDKSLKIKKNSYILHNGNKTIIFHSSQNKAKLKYLKSIGVKVYFIKCHNDNHYNILKILKKIYKLGITSVLVETGPKFLKSILKTNKINQFYLFMSDKKINKSKVTNVKDLINFLSKNYKFSNKINSYLDNNSLLHYY